MKNQLLVDEDSKLVGKMLRTQVVGLNREREELRNKAALLSELHLQVPPESLSLPPILNPPDSHPHFHVLPDNLHGQF